MVPSHCWAKLCFRLDRVDGTKARGLGTCTPSCFGLLHGESRETQVDVSGLHERPGEASPNAVSGPFEWQKSEMAAARPGDLDPRGGGQVRWNDRRKPASVSDR